MNKIQYGLEKADLAKQGWRPGAPAHVKEMHERYAAIMNCHRCKAHGLRAEVWTKEPLVAVFAICSACGYVQEI